MKNIESILGYSITQLEPKTMISIVLKSGVNYNFKSPLTSADFTRIWDSKFFKVKILADEDSLIIINKKDVDLIYISPLEY